IFALDPLYRRIDRDATLKGIRIKSDGGEFELRGASYADDTASYLLSPTLIPRLLQLTGRFGRASGLRLNGGKTLVIALHSRGTSTFDVTTAVDDIPESGRTWTLSRAASGKQQRRGTCVAARGMSIHCPASSSVPKDDYGESAQPNFFCDHHPQTHAY
ncbi:hypothetical protein JG688_00018226, partial [Phytophthora aleatoria]